MSRWQPKRPVREHLAVVQRRNRTHMLAMITDPEQRARFLADFPEENMAALPKKRGPRKPSTGPSEHQEQAAVISWWHLTHKQYGLPSFALFAVPNGGARDAITGSRLKAEGVRAGAPDLILAKPTDRFHGLFIEMKVGYNQLTEHQEAFGDYLVSVGYSASTHWSAGSAIAAIKEYLR